MRSSGILLHISSLPSEYGIGTMGKEAKKFVDFLVKSNQTYWQVLPVGPTGFGDSPYQSFSAFAGNPYFIDIESLIKEKLLKKSECDELFWGDSDNEVDYGILYNNKHYVLHLAYERFKLNKPEEYIRFCENQFNWLDDYALFMSIKDAYEGASWNVWPDVLKFRDPVAISAATKEYEDTIGYYKFLQYYFRKQWFELKKYANENGIKIIGDIPIYVSSDSADVWSKPQYFYLDGGLNPIEVAGCPPDAFSADGQLWGNPLFRWDVLRDNEYDWWIDRIKGVFDLFDVLRIDHFRGFDEFFAIPAKDNTARNGQWKKGPGADLFKTIKEKLGEMDIIAEDLGYLTPSVYELLAEVGYPGMKVLQFAFDSGCDNEYLPHNYKNSNCIVYTGTHDNETSLGWMKNISKSTATYAKEYMSLNKVEGYNWGMIRTAYQSIADTAIIPLQDILSLGNEARMNFPSTQGTNWKWRMDKNALNAKLANRLSALCNCYGRGRK